MPSRIVFRKWVPHTDQPSNLKAGLSRTFGALQQRGELLMTSLLARDLRRKIPPENLVEKIWDWDSRERRSSYRTMSLVDRVEEAASTLSAIYAVGELDREDLIKDLLDEIQDLDKLASDVIHEFVVRCSECAVPIIPSETLASLLVAASDTELGGWTPTAVLDTWEKLRLPSLVILPSAIQWALSEKNGVSRAEARKFGMAVCFDLLKEMALDPGDEKAKYPLWTDKLCQIISELDHSPRITSPSCDELHK